jgi:hypothetical protein
MFDKYKKIRIIGTCLLLVAFVIFVFTGVKFRSVKQYNDDAKKIADQIEQAKKLIPQGSKFKAIYDYTVSEAVPAGNEAFNNGEEIGKQTTTFNLSFTMKQPDGSEGFGAVRCLVDENGKVKFDIDE